MSRLIYNNIELKVLRTRLYARDAVYDPSGTDFLYIHHVLEVEAYYNPEATSYDGTLAIPGIMPAITDLSLRQFLLTPRQRLQYFIGDDLLLQSPIPGLPIDAVNGPHPIYCNVKDYFGDKTFWVSYRIETWTNECRNFDANSPLLSCRWSQSDHIGDDRVTTRTTRGVAVFSMDRLAALGVQGIADNFRVLCIPPEAMTHRRTNLDVGVNPIGNVLTFQAVDVEQLYSLGDTSNPANVNTFDVERFEAVLAESTIPAGKEVLGIKTPAVYTLRTLDVRAFGHPDSLRANLLLFCMRLALEKLDLGQGQVNGGPFLAQARAAQHLHARVTEFHAEAIIPLNPIGKRGGGGLNYFESLFKDPIRILPNDGFVPRLLGDGATRANFVGVLLAQAIQDACTAPQVPTVVPPENPAYRPPAQYPPPTIRTNVYDNVPNYPTHYSDQTRNNGIITEYRIDTNYVSDRGIMHAPYTGPPPGSSGSSGSSGGSTGGGNPYAIPAPVLISSTTMAVALPRTTVIVEWTGERAGNRPPIPAAASNDPSLILLRSQISPTEVNLAADGETTIYRVSGRYEYACLLPVAAGSVLPFNVAPWTDFAFGDALIQTGDYVHGLSDPVGGPQGGTQGGTSSLLGGSSGMPPTGPAGPDA